MDGWFFCLSVYLFIRLWPEGLRTILTLFVQAHKRIKK
jgi:hypothetical protein